MQETQRHALLHAGFPGTFEDPEAEEVALELCAIGCRCQIYRIKGVWKDWGWSVPPHYFCALTKNIQRDGIWFEIPVVASGRGITKDAALLDSYPEFKLKLLEVQR